jgi:hypothetical protein
MEIRTEPLQPQLHEIQSLSRINDLKSRLKVRDEIEFRFRTASYTGSVISLEPKFLEVAFQLSGKQAVRRVPYERVIGILS